MIRAPVGKRLLDRTERRFLQPMVEQFTVTDVLVERTDDALPSLELTVGFRNDSRVDLAVQELDVRVGSTETGGTVHNLHWSETCVEPPWNIHVTAMPTGDEGEVTVQFIESPTWTDAERTLWVDGTLLLDARFELRGHRCSLAQRIYDLPQQSVTLPSADEAAAERVAPTTE